MNKSPGRLDQSFEKVRVLGLRLEPDLLQNIVRFVVALLIPALEESRDNTGLLCNRVAEVVTAPSGSWLTKCEILSPLLIKSLI